jgi:hypothetical protein
MMKTLIFNQFLFAVLFFASCTPSQMVQQTANSNTPDCSTYSEPLMLDYSMSNFATTFTPASNTYRGSFHGIPIIVTSVTNIGQCDGDPYYGTISIDNSSLSYIIKQSSSSFTAIYFGQQWQGKLVTLSGGRAGVADFNYCPIFPCK